MQSNKEELDKIIGFVTEQKRQAIQKVIQNRTRHVAVVLEDVRQSQNTSAVIRSCDCFGVQDLHVIENKFPFKVNKMIVRGSSKWVDVYRHRSEENNTLSCISKLKSEGYKIVATSPHKNDFPIQELPIDEKIALFIGSEGDGLSSEVLDAADYFTTVPMYGFTESLNLSVCTALCLNQLMTRLHDSEVDWKLKEDEKTDLQIQWVKTILKGDTIYDNQTDV